MTQITAPPPITRGRVMQTRSYSTREEWLAARRHGIGASDAAAVLGVSEYKSPFQLWAEKVGELEAEDLSGNEAVEFGIRLERPILEAYSDRTKRPVFIPPNPTVVTHPDRPWMTATPDAWHDDEERLGSLVQVKTCNAFLAREWKDEPPLQFQVQVQHEMAVCGRDEATLVVLIGGQRLRYFDCERNDRFIAAMLEREEEFWDLVQRGIPPEIDSSMATAAAIARLHPLDNGQTVTLPEDAVELLEQLDTAKSTIKAAEEMKQSADNKLRMLIGDASVGLLPNGRLLSLKTQERKEYVCAASTFRVLREIKSKR